MKRVALFTICTSLFAVACGGGEDTGVDASPDAPAAVLCPNSQDPANPGFICPTKVATAWMEDNDTWTEVGPADFSCLNTPSDVTASTVDIDVQATVVDFGDGTAIEAASVEAFPGVDFATVLDTGTTDANGNAVLTLPTGQTYVGYKVTAENALDTYTLHVSYDPEAVEPPQTLNSVSVGTANTVTALLGVTRTEGSGIMAGSISDCNGNTVSDVIATVSSTSGSHDHLEGAQSYYFSGGSRNLPTTHSAMPQTNKDGLFVAIELSVAETAYLQVWGFTGDQNPEGDELTLLAEIPAPVVADSVVVASLEPLRTEQ